MNWWRQRRTWVIAVPVAVLVLALGGPFVWFRVVKDDPPAKLSFNDVRTTTTGRPLTAVVTDGGTTTTVAAAAVTTTTRAIATAPVAAAGGPVDGAWRVGASSISGYRIGETVGVTSQDAVGRTEKVTGTMSLANATLSSGSWTVDMTTVTSDDSRRDQNYRRVMAVDQYPTSTFVANAANFGSVPADGVDVTVPITGKLTLRGKTRDVTFSVQARRKNSRIEVVGNIRVKFADYGIPNPSNGYARTDDHGLIEFLLLFER